MAMNPVTLPPSTAPVLPEPSDNEHLIRLLCAGGQEKDVYLPDRLRGTLPTASLDDCQRHFQPIDLCAYLGRTDAAKPFKRCVIFLDSNQFPVLPNSVESISPASSHYIDRFLKGLIASVGKQGHRLICNEKKV